MRKRSFKHLLLGRALSNDQLKGEKLSTFWGLPIMASDAVSSVAYAVEEILLALVPALGLVAVQYVGFVSVPIILLLVMLVFSYSQIINHYPQGGGAYVVSKENFGSKVSLVTAACLMVDYIMTVAVSVSSSTAAVVAAFPALEPYKTLFSIVCLCLITVVNLRGVSDSSKVFGVPTYIFIFLMVAMIVTGFTRMLIGNLHPIDYTGVANPPQLLSSITLLLFLRAFSNGCSALTGVEAVSDAVPVFKDPSTKTARHVLYLLGITIVFVFGGTSFLAAALKVIPLTNVTVISQISDAIFGHGVFFYALQTATALILLLAANTAYNGLPTLLSILSKDRYLPRQFSQRGTKLSFSNGIMFIFIFAAILIIASNSDTHALIPFYAVGVLVSFTISQSGMFMRWIKQKEKGWYYKFLINGVGALITLIGTFVVFSMKFLEGAWVLLIVIPAIVFFMMYTHRHYTIMGKGLTLEGFDYIYKPSASTSNIPCILMIHNLNRAALKTFDYARELTSNITALHISTTPEHTELLKKQWEQYGIDVPLTVLPAPRRDIFEPMDKYITDREENLADGETLTVAITKFVGNNMMDKIFHNQTTFWIEGKLAKHKKVVTVLVPYNYDLTK